MIEKSIDALKTLLVEEIRKNAIFSQEKILSVSAPGRINIIGEHTDYNFGHILPGAIDRKTYCSGVLSDDEYIYVYSENKNQHYKFKTSEIEPKNKADKIQWYDYIKGVVKEFIDKGYEVKPFCLGTYGDVPMGMGVSSSASFEVAVAKFINIISGLNIGDDELIDITRSAENNYVGVRCGIMDQLASVKGKKGNVIHVDCKDLSNEYIPFPSEKVSIILIDSLKSHSLSNSGYNTRRKECDELLDTAKKMFPDDVKIFRDLTYEILEELKPKVPTNVYNRGKHFIKENDRVIKSISALKSRNLDKLGEMMFLSHRSLDKLYEVSTTGLNRLVELATRVNDICYGSRLMGAGFGGATINLVKYGAEEDFIEKVAYKYFNELNVPEDKIKGNKPLVFVCNIGEGVKVESP
jgi:galactokinase